MTEYEKAFYSDGYKLGIGIKNGLYNSVELFEAVESNYKAIDELIESLLNFAKSQNQAVDCQKGCYWCCHQPVFAMSWEMEYLNDFIGKEFDKAIRVEIQKKAAEKRNKINSLSENQILNSKHPCPLLIKNTCSVYSARPMACRIYLSTSLNSCMNFFSKPEDNSTFPALLDFPLKAGRMMNEGFKAALVSNGFEIWEVRIEEGLKKNTR